MKRQSTRDRVVRDFARLALEGSLPSEARSAIVEAAIKGEVTISEMLRETLILEAGVLDGEPEFVTDWSENDSVPISCPS
jgi:hypothetical protein